MSQPATAIVSQDFGAPGGGASGGRLPAVDPELGHRHPVLAYLAQLASTSRRAVLWDLATIAGLITGSLDEQGRPRGDALGVPWHALRFEHTSALRQQLAERYAPATANRMLSSLRGVLRAAWTLRLMTAEDFHAASQVRAVKGKRLPAGRALKLAEIRRLFQLCAEEPGVAGVRDAAMIAVLYGAGLRRAELVALDLVDYEPERGTVAVRAGKGNKGRLAYLGEVGGMAVQAWVRARGPEPGRLFLPVHWKGKIMRRRTRTLRRADGGEEKVVVPWELSEQAVYEMLQRRAEAAGVPPFTPHDLRRTFAGELLDSGVDISVVQQLMGHASVVTTQRYDRRGEEAKRRAAQALTMPYVPRA